ncbi:MAG: DUF1499 domain-containing protein [Parvularculaceae bacterium]
MARIWIVLAASLAGLAFAAFIPAGSLGYKFGYLELGEAFDLMFRGFGTTQVAGQELPIHVLAGLGASLFAVLAGLIPHPRGVVAIALVALAANLASGYTVWKMREDSRNNPRIHDITTDLENIPEFIAVAPLRDEGDHPVAYEGTYDTRCAGEGEVCDPASLQREHFPDIQPVVLYVGLNEAFDIALDVAEGMGWEIVDVDRAAGRIEATDTTPWFGFKDDIVIRLTAQDQTHTRVDIRSQSRIGQSDLGKNARRVRAYLEELRSRA